MGDLCYTYSDILSFEYEHPNSISGNISRLQYELLNRRQYILLIHQLQHEILESIDHIKEMKEFFYDEIEQLKTLVGLRTSVPKEQVYVSIYIKYNNNLIFESMILYLYIFLYLYFYFYSSIFYYFCIAKISKSRHNMACIN
jgi:hypothetical protein